MKNRRSRLQASKYKVSNGYEKSRIEFREEMQNLFDISPLDVNDIILKDKTKPGKKTICFWMTRNACESGQCVEKTKTMRSCIKRKIMRANQFQAKMISCRTSPDNIFKSKKISSF